MKYLIIYLFTMTSALAGFPPTTIKGQGDTTKPSTFNFEVPNFQSTSLGGTTKLIETGNANELVNAGFEHSTVTTGWTVSNATASANTTTEIQGAKALSLALTGALSLSQSSTINAAQKNGVQMFASVWVNSADVSDLQLCSLRNGAEDKCTVIGGYAQGSGWRQLTVSFIGNATSNGLRLKSTDTTGTVLVDNAFVGVGSPIVDFTPDSVYSAKVTSGQTDENTDFINGLCTYSAGQWTCNFSAGIFSTAPSCVATVNNTGTSGVADIEAVSSTSIRVNTRNSSFTATQLQFYLVCQKQGADYKTSKAYVASSSDFGWTYYTPTFTGVGTVTPASNQCRYRRVRENLQGECLFTAGTVTASLFSVSLPSGLLIDTTKINSSNTTSQPGQAVGIVTSAGTTNTSARIVTATLTSSSLLYAGGVFSSPTPLTPSNGSATFVSSSQTSISFDVPIQGWTDSSVIVGSFQGMNDTPGVSAPKLYSFKVGNTGTVTQDLGDLINGNCSNGTTGLYVCTYNSNKVTATPSCVANNNTGDSIAISTQSASTSGVTFRVITTTTGALTNFGFDAICHGN